MLTALGDHMVCKCGQPMKALGPRVYFCGNCGRNFDGEWVVVFCDESHAHTKECTIPDPKK
jgi:hypothetical protein